jgi:hypothetical protein
VLRYESVIHEFDPYFNYRSTIKLVQDGVYAFWNWFDAESWYPLGRVVGGTVYPGALFLGRVREGLRVVGRPWSSHEQSLKQRGWGKSALSGAVPTPP